MKKFFTSFMLAIVLLLGGAIIGKAQTTLSAGDIAFIGLFAGGSGGVGDAFTFITLKDLSAGTVIYFTDDGWNNGAWGGSSSEVHFTWSPPAGGSPIGTIVTITGGSNQLIPGTPSIGTCSATFLSGTAWHYPTGEEILAYQSSTGARPATPTFIAGMLTYYNSGIYNATTKWCSAVTSGYTESASTLPDGLNNGENCVAVCNASYPASTRNCRYNGSLTGTASAVRTLINSDANWTRDATTSFDITSAAFSAPSITGSVVPTVTTQAVSSISTTTATGNGNITALGSPSPTAYGVCWNTTGTPTTSDSKVDKGVVSTTGAFTASITGLAEGVTYYVRAFAINTAGSSYGGEVSFTTQSTPVITWSNPADITYGTLLSVTQLNATAGVAGTFTYTPALGTKLNAGLTQSLKVDFTPTDAVLYLSTSKTVTINVNKATPVITWGNLSEITYGTLLSATQLNASADVAGIIVYTPALDAKLNAGTAQNLKADFTPADATNYNTATKTVTIDVAKATPVITWGNPSEITYGTLLSATQLNASADVAGIIVYTPALDAKLNAGTAQNLKADFTPADATNYNTATKTVTIDVAKATPVITWSNPSEITYGTLLSATQLNASADVTGTIVYTPALDAKLNAGAAQNLKADFTPTDATNYNTATKTVTIDVAKATPVITWSNPAEITYGTLLSATQLNANADVAGTIVYTPALDAKLNAGTAQNLKADFTPTDVTNYNTATKTVTIDVAKATPVITWSNPSEITYGTLLSATQLNASSDVAGTIVYTPALGAKLNAGTAQNLKADFTPTDATNYNIATKTVTIDVVKATPVITWSNPSEITYGTLLSATQLNASSDVAGTIVYTPALDAKLNAGTAQNLKADFTPTDATNYNTATKTVTIDVAKSTPVITWSNPADISNLVPLSSAQLNATADVAGSFIFTPALGAILSVGNGQNLKADFTPTDAVNYNTATKTVSINIFLGVGIEEAIENKLVVYPNPMVDAFQVAGFEGMAAVSLTDLNGKVMLAKQISAYEIVSVNAIPKGIYIIKITINKAVVLKKMVKK